MSRIPTRAILTLAALAVLVPAAESAVIVVTTTSDNMNPTGNVSLREAFQAAITDTSVDGSTAGNGADRIVFHPSLDGATIFMALGEFQTTDSDTLIIDASMLPNGITIDAGGASRHLYAQGAHVEFRRVTLRGGSSTGGGGAVLTYGGSLVLRECTVIDNHAVENGGGVRAVSSPNLTIIDSVIRDNTADDEGGGVYYSGWSDKSFVMENSRVVANRAATLGGGVRLAESGVVSFVDAEIDSNVCEPAVSTDYGMGGGIYNEGDLDLLRVSVSHNRSLAGASSIGAAFSGGIITYQGYVTLTDCVVSWNHNDGATVGGAIANNYHAVTPGTVEITGTTIQGNTGATDVALYSAHTMNVTDSYVLDNVADTGSAVGGGFSGAMTLTRVLIQGNQGVDGGAVTNGSSSTMTLIDCELAYNTVTEDAGAVLNLGTMTITGGSIHHNLAVGDGGALLARTGDLVVSGVRIHDNQSSRGGGVMNDSQLPDSVLLPDCAIFDNLSTSDGGGLFVLGDMDVIQCTVAGNTAYGDGGGIMHGNGYSVADGLLVLKQCTISANTAGLLGGGVALRDDTEFGGCIISGNTGTGGVDDFATDNLGGATGVPVSTGYNLIGEYDTQGFAPTDQTNVLDPMLGPLQDNGGPTETMAVLYGSPAIDGSTALHVVGLVNDQRGAGYPRVIDGNIGGLVPDCGAFEFELTCDLLVTKLVDDDTPGTLRYELACAAAGDTVRFDPVVAMQTIELNGTQIDITDDVVIHGEDQGVAVSALGLSRVFEVASGVTATIHDLAVTGGAESDGGGILTWGALRLYGSRIHDNLAADDGGGVAAFGGGTILVYDSTVEDNTAAGDGGGLYGNGADGSVIVTLSQIRNNTADQFGGGLAAVTGCSMSSNKSTFEGNDAGNGGGVYSSTYATLSNSTVSANTANGSGGGVNAGGTLNLIQSTVTGNAASWGGGLSSVCDHAILKHNTITANSAVNGGGGLRHTGTWMEMNSNVAWGNTASAGIDDVLRDALGNLVSRGYNVVGEASSASMFTQTGDQDAVADARLGAFGDHGGPTWTIPLLFGSPAVDAGDPAECASQTDDQRGAGFPRALDGDGDSNAVCDVGAFEAELLEMGIPVAAEDTPTGLGFNQFTGAGFAPDPATDQLDSDEILVRGLSQEPVTMDFGHSGTDGPFARGTASSGTDGGVYAISGGGVTFLGLQPSATDLTPGSVVVAFRNETGVPVTDMAVAHRLYAYNKGDRSTRVRVAWAQAPAAQWDVDALAFTDIPALDVSTAATASGSPSWNPADFEETVTGLAIPPGGFFYVRYLLSDDGGTGDHDTVGLDNVVVRANPPVGTGVDDGPLLPAGLSHRLGSVRPNPFNPQATVALALAREQHVRVDVYDVAGRLVRVLHDGVLSADREHVFTLTGKDLPSATYLVRARGADFTEVRRAVLLK